MQKGVGMSREERKMGNEKRESGSEGRGRGKEMCERN